jgi:iron complex outermembrane receptor protein/vitamin B12 transporter
LILIDDVPYYKTSHVADAAAVDLRSLPLENIERIEIVKGAGSALYGSMAAAGVINIITRKPEGTGASILAEAGTNDWRRGNVRAWTTNENFGVSVWYSRKEEGESPLLRYSGSSGTIEDKNLDYTGDFAGLSMTTGPFAFSANWGNYQSLWTYGGYDQRQENDFGRFSLSWKQSNNTLVLYHMTDDKELFQDSAYGITETDVDDCAWGLEFTRRIPWGDNLVSWGAAFRDEDMSYSIPVYGTQYDRSRTNYAPFLEVSRPVGDLLLNLGLRYEMWDQDDADDYDEVMPKLSLLYQTFSGSTWYLSAGRFFAMPSLYELSYFGGAATEPNADLKPEKGYTYEIGVKGEETDGKWNLGLFYMTMDDKIDILSDWSKYINVDEYRAWGIEASRDWRLSRFWNLQIGTAWTNAEERTAGGEWIKGGAPQWDIHTSIAYYNGPFMGELTLRHLGDREDERPGIGPLSQKDVTTLDAVFEYSIGDETLRLSAYNVFDEEYYLQDYTKYGTTTRYYGPERRIYLTWEHVF